MSLIVILLFQQDTKMSKIILTAECAAIAGISGNGAFAQTTGPAGQDTTKMASEANNSMSKESTSGMSNGGMAKENMRKNGMAKKDMSKNGMKRDDMEK
jgi:pentapeptide MXKDX repeat protein